MKNRTQNITETALQPYKMHATDTGSTEVQLAQLTSRIQQLNEHFSTHAKDYASKTGLVKMVSQRRRLLNYLKKSDKQRYEAVIASLGLRR